MYIIKTPFWLRFLYRSLTWRKPADSNQIFLTFDDGPIPIVTPFVLKTLKEFDAKATFFCIGDNITKHPEIFQQVKEDGHLLGNHTFNHLKGWDTDDEVYVSNMLKCQELVDSNFFRPPHGRIKYSQVGKLRALFPHLNIIMWDVLSGDFDVNLSPEKCLQNVLKHTVPGSIIVFHDSLKAFDRLQYTLPRALAHWKSKGFIMSTLA